ncbi:MAG: D-allulose 6-phosphate 3-epimerase [Treponema sp.]|jgi:D-allulose-6-phosphate 3-epimerase|nr:D-allulose 6-phosphate 3-epimerase [Treponema sp.]
MKPLFNPSLMCMDLLDIKNQIETLNDKASFFHVDIMDGHYVKNITLSPDFVKTVKAVSKIPIDCHLMVTNPEDFIEPLAEAGADYISPHAEVINAKAFRLIDRIHALGCKAGVAVNPETSLQVVESYLDRLDKITIMSVDPGFAGQPFIPEVLKKISELKRLKELNGYHYLIEIDGSCNKRTFRRLAESGVEVYIVGSSGLFSLDKDLSRAWEKMITDFNNETKGL